MHGLMFKGALAVSIAFALSLSGAVGAQTSGSNDLAARINATSISNNGSYDRFIIRYKTTAPTGPIAATQSAAAAVGRAGKLQASLSSRAPLVSYKRQLATGAHLVATSRKLTAAEATAFMQSIASDPTVAYVQPDVMRQAIGIKAPASFTPNDPLFAKYQTDYLPGDGTLTSAGNSVANWGGANITGAWNLADGTGITIAVLDTGIVKHADIDTSLADDGYDFISDGYTSGRSAYGRAAGGWDMGDWTTGAYSSGANACADPSEAKNSSWHGSHVAGATGAEITNNSTGMAGIAYNAKVLPIRVLGHCGGHDSDIVDAIVWASGGHVDGVPDNKHPAQVINMSLGGSGACSADDAYGQAIAKARANGTTVVVAAGNDGGDVNNTSPASCPGVITVASTGVGSGLAFYSNYNSPGESIVKLAAFGGGVYPNEGTAGSVLNPEGFAWQAINKGTTVPLDSPAGDKYGGMVGTSQATPHVTGTVALMQSARIAAKMPLLTPDEVLAALQKTARTPHTTPNPGKTFGAGILDAGAAVAEVLKGGGGTPTDNATVLKNGVALTGQKGDAGSETFYKIDVPAGGRALVMRTAGGSGDVSLYVKAGGMPSSTSYDASSVHAGNAESVLVTRVSTATTYYLRVFGVQAYSGVSVQATFAQ